ncbi:hypothetical protein [uncultured Lactobacillus sp.]|uniref:hypothetical protein n=1 Tax=uncultured Lactobacillus sp. TaxID=153152 RepID=UPI00260EE891|nr:hypothetical protein [uncultured Lactobacillus sp.]
MGYFVIATLFILSALIALVFALIDTLRNRQDGVYYYVEDKKKTKCSNFGEAFKKYYVDNLFNGVFDAIDNLWI